MQEGMLLTWLNTGTSEGEQVTYNLNKIVIHREEKKKKKKKIRNTEAHSQHRIVK